MKRLALAGLLALLVPLPCPARQPSQDQLDNLSRALRAFLVENMPATLHEKSENWGKTVRIPNDLTWRGLKPEVQLAEKNHGTWRKVRLAPHNLRDSLFLLILNYRKATPKTSTFDLVVAFEIAAKVEQQNWANGVKLFAGEVRATFRAKAAISCELTTEFKPSGGLLPDIVFRLRAVKADLGYDSVKFEHVPGIGGEAAEILGKAAHDLLKQLKPSLQRDLETKLEAAIVKAADTKEIRLGLGGLSRKK